MKKSGYYFTEMMPSGKGNPKPGKAEPEYWGPYKVWCGDLWECPDCGATIVSGTGNAPLVEHYMDDFKEIKDRVNAQQLEVKDC